ncbi:alpha-N-arabinofuranosidase [Sphaerisporangium dianthi]|uniref:non-reducing end alpha-L-arabinofuranosidase n=1 Tax=Sphaerisporangium dianthi TaxID=1436120 RepID=A0ABV9CT87_9ACTN
MYQASLTIDPAFRVAPVRRRTFGTFVEHLGRCVYTGIHEPGHPTADEDGFRRDVLDLTRELGVSTVRYPGGNFVSGYRWEDGIGPAASRPSRLDLAWHCTEPNQVGVDEFVRWARKAGVEPMMAVNLGTRGVQEALDILEYCNIESGTHWSDLRVANGAKEPHGIGMWCLGNEMDGPWQIGHKTAREYGRLAAETARAMRMIDPGLELVACGSSGSSMPTFGAWEAEVLEEAYEQVDYISCHAYYEEKDGDLASFLACSTDMENFIASVVSTADHVRARLRATKRVNVSFDEWNVWYLSRFQAEQAKEPPRGWPVAPPLLEERYHLADAVAVGGLLITLLRNSDRVTAASQAQLVNVIAPIMTEPGGRAWRQTIFHPFAQASRYASGDVLRVEPVSPMRETAEFGEVPLLHAVATRDDDVTTVFAVNRSTDRPLELTLDARALGEVRLVEATTLSDPDVYAVNTADDPDRIAPRANPDVETDPLRVVLPPVSWNVIRLTH